MEHGACLLRCPRELTLRITFMNVTTKDQVYTFQPRRIALGVETPSRRRARRNVIEDFLKALNSIIARRRRVRIRSQLAVAHQWERARRN